MKSLFTLVLLLAAQSSRADVPGEDLATAMTRLVQVRAEVETLGRELEADSRNLQRELEVWTQKKLDLEGQLQKEELRRVQINEKIKRITHQVAKSGHSDPEALAEFTSWVAAARERVKSSLPFRLESRLATLDELEARAKRRLESLEALTSELWRFYESELKLAKTNEYRITDTPKAEVVRLGLVALFTRKPDGTFSRTEMAGATARTSPITDSRAVAQVTRLMEAIKSKRKSGFFELPLENGASL